MTNDEQPTSLTQFLDRLADAGDGEAPVSIQDLFEAAGRRAFGSILLVPGLIALSPLSGIPGMPSTVGVLVLLITGQMLLGRNQFWLPAFLMHRRVSRSKFDRALNMLRPVARFIDRLLRPRLVVLTRGIFLYLIAGLCALIAVTMPPLELVPFAASSAGAALTAFGLALMAHDGVLALIALTFCVAAGVLIGSAVI